MQSRNQELAELSEWDLENVDIFYRRILCSTMMEPHRFPFGTPHCGQPYTTNAAPQFGQPPRPNQAPPYGTPYVPNPQPLYGQPFSTNPALSVGRLVPRVPIPNLWNFPTPATYNGTEGFGSISSYVPHGPTGIAGHVRFNTTTENYTQNTAALGASMTTNPGGGQGTTAGNNTPWPFDHSQGDGIRTNPSGDENENGEATGENNNGQESGVNSSAVLTQLNQMASTIGTLVDHIQAVERAQAAQQSQLFAVQRSMMQSTAPYPSGNTQRSYPPDGLNQGNDPSLFQFPNHWQANSTPLGGMAPNLPNGYPGNNEDPRGYRACEPTKPYFTGDLEASHPVEFLLEIDRYIVSCRLDPVCRLQLAFSCLEGEAKAWARGFGYLLTDYDQFCVHFLQQYWGQRAQRLVREEMMYGTYSSKSISRMAEYFLGLVAKARYLIGAPSEMELVLNLSHHFPRNVCSRLSSCSDIKSAYAMLQIEDHHNNNTQRNNFAWKRTPEGVTNAAAAGGASGSGGNSRNWRDAGNNNRAVRATTAEAEDDAELETHPIANIFVGPEELLAEDNVDNDCVKVEKSPVIEVLVCERPMLVLLDSGSELSCIDGGLYREVKARGVEMCELPVQKTTIQGAFGGKKKTISNQIFLPVHISGEMVDVPLIVVEDLCSPMIFGMDTLHHLQACLLFNTREVCLVVNDKEVRLPFNVQDNQHDHIALNRIEADVNRGTPGKVSGEASPLFGVSNLTDTERSRLDDLLHEFEDVFSDKPGLAHQYEHEIRVTDDSSFCQKQYPIPYKYMDKVRCQIQKMEEWGIISRAPTSYINPLVVTMKKSGEARVCLDARRLNKVLERDNEKPPEVQRLLQKLEGTKYFSLVDLTSSYWQIPVKEEHRKFTGFLFDHRSYVFNVLPFGLNTAVASFSRAMDFHLGPEVLQFTEKYLDDLLVHSSTFDEHLGHLRALFTKLREAGLTVSPSKSEFAKHSVKFLGHVVGPEGVSVDPDKLKAIEHFPSPTNEKSLKSFLGLVSYVSRFTPNYASTAKPLYALLKATVGWKWERDEQTAFEATKQLFLTHTTLQYPITGKQFCVQTDSSYDGLGAILFQKDERGNRMVTSYASRLLQSAESNYSATELEALAIVWALNKWRQYLLGASFVVYTDHKALIFLKRCQLLNGRLTRWILFLQQFDFEIVHCRGSENEAADALSRYPVGAIGLRNASDGRKLLIARMAAEVKEFRKLMSKLPAHQANDSEWRELWELTGDKVIRRGKRLYQKAKEVLFVKEERDQQWRIVIPPSLIETTLKYFHDDSGHFGLQKTYQALRSSVFWKGMRNSAKEHVRACLTCQYSKPSLRPLGGSTRSILPTRPNELISVDLFGPLPAGPAGVRYVFVMIDVFSKYVTFDSVKKPTATVLWRKLERRMQLLGKPAAVLCDQGTQFTAKFWRRTLKDNHINLIFTSVRHPQANPVERTMRELSRLCRAYCQLNHRSWAPKLSTFANWINCAYHESTERTPHELQLGEPPRDALRELFEYPDTGNCPVDIDQVYLMLRNKARKRNRNAKPQTTFFSLGDKVLLRSNPVSSEADAIVKKFINIYEGPYVIQQVVQKDVFILAYPNHKKQRGMFHINLLKPFVPSKNTELLSQTSSDGAFAEGGSCSEL